MPIDRTAFNALADDDGSNTTGSVWDKDAIEDVLLDPIDAAIAASVSPAGSNTQVQFNDSSAFGGDAGLTYNKTTDILTAGGVVLGAGGLKGTTALTIGTMIINGDDANQNNWNPTGLSGAAILLCSGASADRTITGLQGGVDGRVLIFLNRSGFSYLFTSEDAASTDVNRFRTANSATVTCRTNGMLLLCYAGRWHVHGA